jgi:small-conductance mechanosensitive channel
MVFELLRIVGASMWQANENILERLWRWTDPLRHYVNFKWQLGNFVFSLTTLALGLFVFLIAVFVSRYLRSFLERRMERRRLDPGVQHTALRVIHYVIMVFGVLYALRIAIAADFTSLAVIFTALSVGIGFGLQFIAGDLASGFILLFERPVRVGDYITVAGADNKPTEGRVKSINLRSTVVATNDNIIAVLPNSRLVNQVFLNWSYREGRSHVLARVPIMIGVAYDSDVELVTQTLLRSAEGVAFVLDDPKPSVQFLEFGSSSLSFRLLVWTDRPRRHPQIKSDINYRILELFQQASIKIPCPQTEVFVRGGTLNIEQDVAQAAGH